MSVERRERHRADGSAAKGRRQDGRWGVRGAGEPTTCAKVVAQFDGSKVAGTFLSEVYRVQKVAGTFGEAGAGRVVPKVAGTFGAVEGTTCERLLRAWPLSLHPSRSSSTRDEASSLRWREAFAPTP